MSRTVETQHREILDRVNAIDLYIKKLSLAVGLVEIDTDDPFSETAYAETEIIKNPRIEASNPCAGIIEIKSRLTQLRDDYTMATYQAMLDFYENMPGAGTRYTEAMELNLIDNRFDEIISLCLMLTNKARNFIGRGSAALLPDANQLKKYTVDKSPARINYESCCGAQMSLDIDRSILYCESCKMEFQIKGVIFNETQVYSQDVQPIKHCKYDRQRNFLTWKNHIWATDGFNLEDRERSIIKKYLVHYLQREKLGTYGAAHKLTIKHVREFLDEYGFSRFNKNGASILAQASGVYPPLFSDRDSSILDSYYSRILNILNNSKNPDLSDPELSLRENTPYCPYFIAKIIEARWSGDEEKQLIQCYIFHKKPETVEKLDRIWSVMCKMIGFEFVATSTAKCPDPPALVAAQWRITRTDRGTRR